NQHFCWSEGGMSSSAARFFLGTFGKRAASILAEPPSSQSSSTEAEVEEGCDHPRLPSDETLMALICDGDKEAFASLFRRYARVVRGVAYRVLRAASEADALLKHLFFLIT